MKTDIGIIGALAEEVEGLIAGLENHKTEVVGGIEFHSGIIEKKQVVIARCGVGKVFAALCAQAMIVRYAPALIVNSGVGGALGAGLRTGDVVIADRLCQHDMDTSPLGDPKGLISGINKVYFETDGRAREILLLAAHQMGLTVKVGTVATGDRFIADKASKQFITDTFGAIACEMEGGAIAHTAFVSGTPCAVIRAISDSADGEASMSYTEFLPLAAKNSTALTLALIKAW